MRSRWILPVLFGAILGSTASRPARGDDDQESAIRESVVKITATMRYPDLFRPWAKQSPREASGTGVVIEGMRTWRSMPAS